MPGEESQESDMEFQPMLYVRKDELPPNITDFMLVSQLENVYGCKGQFRITEGNTYFCVGFPSKSVATKAHKDGLDFGGTHVVMYDIFNHIMWLKHSIKA